MTACSRGDVVLFGFVFSDQSGRKLRPALVISTDPYHRSRREAIVAAITSNTARPLFGDHPIEDWQGAGLLRPSVVTGIVRTISRSAIQRTVGVTAGKDLRQVDDQLRRTLGI